MWGEGVFHSCVRGNPPRYLWLRTWVSEALKAALSGLIISLSVARVHQFGCISLLSAHANS